MRHPPAVALCLLALALPAAAAPDASIRVELNGVESAEKTCRLTFVLENKTKNTLESLKLDLAVFNPEGVVQRRLVTELAPIRSGKTMVRTFALDGECGQIGSILVNDVTICAPAKPDVCLDQLALSSKVKSVRFFK
jgi:hypothetical protein